MAAITIEEIQRRIHEGWEKYPIARPYIFLKKETYIKLKSVAVFIDVDFGEWEAMADGVMRGGMHPKRRQRDFSKLEITKDEFYNLYIEQNLSVKELALKFNCNKKKILDIIVEFDLKKPMSIKLDLMKKTNQERYGCEFVMQNTEISKKVQDSRDVEKFKKTYKKTMVERYGVENGFQDETIASRAKKTMQEKYGTEHALQAEECRDKYLKTIRDKYQDGNLVWGGLNVEEIKNKVKATNLSNLGVESPFGSKDVQDKVKQTFVKNYGVECISKSPVIQGKIRKSILNRFGVHHLSLPEIREQIKATSLEKYGVVCSLQNPEVMQKSYETKVKNDSFNSSIAEREIRSYVTSLVGEVKQNVRDIISPYELDIVIPHKRLAIEYNGLYWHSEAQKPNDYHANKLKRCTDANYRLISIFEHEWHNRPNAVKSRLRAILGCNKNIIGARDTQVSEAEIDEVRNFLNEFHLQGFAKCQKALKLTFNDLIVAVMTFSRHHRQTSKELVLNRYCVREDYSIIGGANKLFKNADIKETVISYSDNRWSEGDIYPRLNFKLDRSLKPDYFYISNKGVFSKQSLKKNKEERESKKSEHELRLEQGYLRVYDCGKKRWRFDQWF